ncbi:MAG: hypothetical protein BWY26_00788 [Elusimicrobia bacterium ADurb.Bin231]|nr:MAG: hypothetical protein BWY26_00788 [Elusimicrobia bacterium ADurb.Bin231]
MKLKNILLYLFVLLFAVCIPAADLLTGAGVTGGSTLLQPFGARPSGMGEAFTAVKGDLTGIFYNPAAIYGIRNQQISVQYSRGLISDTFGSVFWGKPFKFGVLGASVLYYNAGDIDLIDLSGKESTVNAQRDFLGILTFGKMFGRVCFGSNIKLLHTRLVEEVSATAFMADLGANIYFNKRLGAGVSVSNLGGKLKYIDVGDDLPMTFRSGIFYHLVEYGGYSLFMSNQSLSVAVDAVKLKDDDITGNIGVEYGYYTDNGVISARFGYKAGYDLAGMTMGAGISHGRISIDYALLFMDIAKQHRFGLSYRFGK